MTTYALTTHAHEYLYKLHPDEPKLILVRRNIHGATWRWYGAFQSEQTAAIALEALRMAAAREAARQGRVARHD